jgi:hypothetical protein
MASDTYASQSDRRDSQPIPGNSHLSVAVRAGTWVSRLPKTLTCAQKVNGNKGISPHADGLFSDAIDGELPKSLTCESFRCKTASRKRSPIPRGPVNDMIPEKPHLDGYSKDRFPFLLPKNLTLRSSGSVPTSSNWAKPTLCPENPHAKSPWSPEKPHLSRKTPKKWAKSGREEAPVSSHRSLHRQKTVQADMTRPREPWSPETAHL